jgi:predicted nucleic acid-binding Zn ribbon protein
MDCPNCGVYNPEDRQVCWRCDQELPKPQERKKRTDPNRARIRMWIIIAIVIAIWILATWLLPLFLGGGAVVTPTP